MLTRFPSLQKQTLTVLSPSKQVGGDWTCPWWQPGDEHAPPFPILTESPSPSPYSNGEGFAVWSKAIPVSRCYDHSPETRRIGQAFARQLAANTRMGCGRYRQSCCPGNPEKMYLRN